MNPIKLALCLAVGWVGVGLLANGQEALVYVNGPQFPFQYQPSEPEGASLDLDRDGTPDFTFELGYFISPASLSNFSASAPYYVSALGTNGFLLERFNSANILSFGTIIGNSAPTNSTWSSLEQFARVATYWISASFPSGVYGPLAERGVGYLGIRFYAADGLHYGWIRIRNAPVAVVDWAYEARPNTPVRAGIIGSNGESLQFLVDFQGPNGSPQEGTGTFILTGNILRGEFIFPSLFSEGGIFGPSPVHSKAKPVATFGDPLAARSGYTAFLSDIPVSNADLVQILRGKYYVSIQQHTLIGQIRPIN